LYCKTKLCIILGYSNCFTKGVDIPKGNVEKVIQHIKSLGIKIKVDKSTHL